MAAATVSPGLIGDQIGRVRTMIIAAALFGASAIGSALALAVSDLVPWRVLGAAAAGPQAVRSGERRERRSAFGLCRPGRRLGVAQHAQRVMPRELGQIGIGPPTRRELSEQIRERRHIL